MDADDRLKRLLADSAVPARDFAFQTTVMQRVARRRFLFSLLALAPWAGLAAFLLWVVRPPLGQAAAGASSAAGVIAALLVLVWAARALGRADPAVLARLPNRILSPGR